jgi:hypothetical protein
MWCANGRSGHAVREHEGSFAEGQVLEALAQRRRAGIRRRATEAFAGLAAQAPTALSSEP